MASNRLSYVDLLVDGKETEFFVARYRGVEEISRLFDFEASLLHPDPSIPFGEMFGREATLEFGFDEGAVLKRYVHGVIAEFEHGGAWRDQGRYRIRIVPTIWPATLGRNSAIYRDAKVDEVVHRLLREHGIEAKCPAGAHPLKYLIQYDESDWDFVQRLLEAAGYCYYFTHDAGQDQLVMLDGQGFPAIEAPSTLVYRPDAGGLVGGSTDVVDDLAVRQMAHPLAARHEDYDFQNCNVPVEGREPAKAPKAHRGSFGHGDLGRSSHGAAGPTAPGAPWGSTAAAMRSAKVAAEMFDWQRLTAAGRTTCPRFSAGHSFDLEDHPGSDGTTSWVLHRVEHEGSQSVTGNDSETTSGHVSRFWCFAQERPYRPLPRTPKQRIWGTQPAKVVAVPESDLDAAATVSVVVHWPCRQHEPITIPGVPVSQLFAGAGGHGAVFLPRIDEVVLLEFLDGDPERPVIVGRIYDGVHKPPYALPAERSKSTIKSLSYREGHCGEGYNELTFEDREGSEEIYLHGQRDHRIEIEHDKTQSIGHDDTLEVGNDQQKEIGGNQSETVGRNQSVTVRADQSVQIDGSRQLRIANNCTTEVSGSSTEQVTGNHQAQVNGSQTLTVVGPATHRFNATKQQDVAGSLTESVAGAKQTQVLGGETHVVHGQLQTTVVGARADLVTEDQSIIVSGNYTLTAGSATVSIDSDGNIVITGGDVSITGSGPIAVSGSKLEVKSDGAVSVEASGAVKVKGSAVDIN